MLDKNRFKALIENRLEAVHSALCSISAIELLMGTCAVESDFGTHRHQIGGKAHGIFQIEYATFLDLQERYESRYPVISKYTFDQLLWDDPASIIIARLKYLDIREPLPKAGDTLAQSGYWKRHYNTNRGKGTIELYLDKYREYCR